MTRRALLATALVTLIASPLFAGDAETGRQTAKQWCGDCHLIGDFGTATDSAPPFASIANNPEKTPDYLKLWLSDPHGQMPKLHMTRQEIDVVVDYILSLRNE